MSQPSTALRALERAIALMPEDQPVTWNRLQDKVAEAAADAEDTEHLETWGDDV